MAKQRILIVSDAVACTGLARVAYNIFHPLHEKYDLHQIARNYNGEPNEWPWKLYPARLGDNANDIERIKPLTDELRPDLMVMIDDFYNINGYLFQLKDLPVESRPITIAYTPVDGNDLDPDYIQYFSELDLLVAYTEFSKQEFRKAEKWIQVNRPDFRLPDMRVLPHGVDTDIYYPLDGTTPGPARERERREIRKALWPDREDIADAFIILNANRNQPRKRIDATIEGFSRFAEDKPDSVKLYLHMGLKDHGWHIVKIAGMYGILNRLLLSTQDEEPPEFSQEELNEVYNACQVGLNTAVGEGWGLVSFEHAATGAAQVVPNHSACAELWQGAAEIMPVATHSRSPQTLTNLGLVDAQAVADALERLYADPAYLAELSEAAYKNATQPAYEWKQISKRWEELFAEILSQAV